MAVTMNGFPGFGTCMDRMDSTADIDRLLQDDGCDFGSSSESSSVPIQHEDEDTCEFFPSTRDPQYFPAGTHFTRLIALQTRE